MGASRIPVSDEGPSRSEEKLFRALRRRKGREDAGLFLAEGRRVVADLLASGLDLHMGLVVSSFGDTEEERTLLDGLAARCTVRRVAGALLAELADTDSPQGVLVAGRVPAGTLEGETLRAGDVVLVLDGVQDPGNVGTLVRTADALGVRLVVTLPGTVDPWNPKVVRAAAGSLFRLPPRPAAPAELAAWLAREGAALLAADMDGAPPRPGPAAAPVALVVGNEGAGLSPNLRAAADALVGIPIRGGAESLNVAVAAGILLYLLTRRDDAPGTDAHTG